MSLPRSASVVFQTQKVPLNIYFIMMYCLIQYILFSVRTLSQKCAQDRKERNSRTRPVNQTVRPHTRAYPFSLWDFLWSVRGVPEKSHWLFADASRGITMEANVFLQPPYTELYHLSLTLTRPIDMLAYFILYYFFKSIILTKK